jgi:transposase
MIRMSSTRRKFSKEFKLKVVQAYESGTSVACLTREYDIHANLVYKWTEEYRNNPVGAFRGSADADHSNSASEKRIAELEQMVGRLTMELEFLKKALKRAETTMKSNTPNNGTA